jgi:hypothetical protein
MKYRNKRIGLNSDLLTHLIISVQIGLTQKVTKYQRVQNEPKGQREEWDNTCRSQQLFASVLET